jgi:hypothetical protein
MKDFLLALSNTPVEAWQGLIGALAGGLLTFIAVSRTNQSNRKQLQMELEHTEKLQRQRIQQDRLEELYGLVTQWDRSSHKVYVTSCQFMESTITAKKWLDTFNDVRFNVHDSRLDMLFSLYLTSSLEAFYAARSLNDSKLQMVRSYNESLNAKAPRTELLKEYKDINAEFSTAIKLLQTQIVKAAKEV